jgi:predicted nucleic-acid-binding Zn-ribbon protein
MNNKCPKCGGEFEEGKVDSMSEAHTLTGLHRWYQKLKMMHSFLDNPKEIIVYRCKSCGYLESYAK